MVGMGVTENAELRPHVKAGADGFSITYIRAPKGKGAALHRHATEEVFLPIHGRWQVFWLEGEQERTLDLDEGDMCNVPIGIYRGFRPRARAASKALSIRRDAMPPRAPRRHFSVGERHHAAGKLVIRHPGHAIGVQFEAGKGGIVADGAGHQDYVGLLERSETHPFSTGMSLVHPG